MNRRDTIKLLGLSFVGLVAPSFVTADSAYHVTNLHDSGLGSFRWGMEHGARVIKFDVGGDIYLTSLVRNPNAVRIIGETAPTRPWLIGPRQIGLVGLAKGSHISGLGMRYHSQIRFVS